MRRVPPYSMRIAWDPDDRIFVVAVPELPGCMTHGDTYEEAARKGREAIASWVGAARHWGTPIPQPLVERHELAPFPSGVAFADADMGQASVDPFADATPDWEQTPQWLRDEVATLTQRFDHLPTYARSAAISAIERGMWRAYTWSAGDDPSAIPPSSEPEQ